MIRYSLKCANGHGFDSWFQSAGAFDGLAAAGHVQCPVCGDDEVDKALMAPRVAAKDTAVHPEGGGTIPEQPAELGASYANVPAPVRAALEKMRAEVERNSDYVGRGFAKEARDMHRGDVPERAIHGEANAEEARALLRDGIPIMPLPFRDRRGTN